MGKKPLEPRDNTSLVISAVFHILLIGGVAWWAWRSGKMEIISRRVMEWVRTEAKSNPPEQQKIIPQTQAQAPKLPPINQGMRPPPSGSGGTRRAVASDAPAASGDTFFQDTRKQVDGKGTAGGSGAPRSTTVPVRPAAPPVAPRSALKFAGPTTIAQLNSDRSRQAAATEAIGAEQISRTGGSDAGDIITKVAGAAVVDGKFAVIRGLSDRYVSTTLNGAEVPSPDPYRRSASLDMFPSQIISKVVVAKTFTPDQPGTYTGGGINIVTKSFPEKSFATISLGVSFNTQTSMNDKFLTYHGGGLDWAGMDDGTRALPDALSAPDLKLPSAPVTTGRPTSDTFRERQEQAARLDQVTRIMGGAQFAPDRDAPPLNHNFSLALGDTTHFFGKALGVFAGLNYRRDFSGYETGISRRYAPGSTPGTFEIRKNSMDSKGVEEVNWAGIVNLAYQLHDNHQLGFNFLYNQNSENLARVQRVTNIDDAGVLFHQNRLHFTERNLQAYQVKGNHLFPLLAHSQLDWLASISDTSQDEPDTRFFNFAQQGTNLLIGKASSPDPKNPTRYFRTLEEKNRNLKADLTIPFRQWTFSEGAFKLGAYDSTSERTFADREVYYLGDAAFSGDPNSFLQERDFGYTSTTNRSGSITYNWKRYIQTRDSAYLGQYGVKAGYLMLDLPVGDRARLVGGVRYELTDIEVSSRSYLANSITAKSTNSSQLDQKDLLPAAGLIYSLNSNMNLRLSYSQTVARPSFRELAGYRSYDPSLDELLDGNPNLEMSSIQNYDLRWEWFPRPGEIVGVSLFYKSLSKAIERRFVTIDGEIISFANRPDANVMGIEFEGRKSLGFLDPLLSDFSIGGNFSLIQSEVELTREELFAKTPRVPGTASSRPLYDQSPYILNLDLSYDNVRSGTAAALIFNVYGPRISIASLNTEDVYEQPAPYLDFVISQRIGRKMSVKFSAKNLLNPLIERTYGKAGSLLYSSFQRGMTFGLSMAYDW